MANTPSPKGRTAPTQLLNTTAVSLAAYYLCCDNVSQASHKLYQTPAALSTQNPKKYGLPEKISKRFCEKILSFLSGREKTKQDAKNSSKIPATMEAHDAK